MMEIINKLKTEEQELTTMLNNLQVFIREQSWSDKPIVSEYHLSLLIDQEHYMNEYAKTLRARIADLVKHLKEPSE